MRIITVKNTFWPSEAEAERKYLEKALQEYRLERAIEFVTEVMQTVGLYHYPLLADFLQADKEHYHEYIKKHLSHKRVTKEMKLMNRVEWVNYQTEKLRKERAVG